MNFPHIRDRKLERSTTHYWTGLYCIFFVLREAWILYSEYLLEALLGAAKYASSSRKTAETSFEVFICNFCYKLILINKCAVYSHTIEYRGEFVNTSKLAKLIQRLHFHSRPCSTKVNKSPLPGDAASHYHSRFAKPKLNFMTQLSHMLSL